MAKLGLVPLKVIYVCMIGLIVEAIHHFSSPSSSCFFFFNSFSSWEQDGV